MYHKARHHHGQQNVCNCRREYTQGSSLHVLFTASWISLIQLLLFGFCGLGLARTLLPVQLRQHELTLAPIFGLALLALFGFYGANIGLTMRQILPVALIVAVLLLAASTLPRRSRRPLGILPLAELLPLLAISLVTWLVHIWPDLNYGMLVPIGHNWDVEFYLPMADYLKQFSYATLHLAPPNPLRQVVMASPTIERAMGATYAQSMADLIAGHDAWDSWVPMLALLRSLTLAGLYALLRDGLGVRPLGALVGVAIAGLNSLLLWTTYNSFGMSIGGLALLPAALVCLLGALETAGPRPILGAAILLAGLTCTYWPMLQVYGTAGAGLGLALLWERRRQDILRVIGRGLGVLIIGSILGILAHLRAQEAWLDVIAMQTPSMGVFDFISPAVMFGSAPYAHRGLPTPGTVGQILIWSGLAALILLLVQGVWRGAAKQGRAFGLAIMVIAYLLALRFIVQFPYGLLRGTSYANTLLLGLAGAGVWPLLTQTAPRLRTWPRMVGVGLALVLGLSMARASYRTYEIYAQNPAVFDRDTFAARTLVPNLRQPGPILFSPAADIRGTYLGAWAYNFLNRPLLGIVKSGFGLSDNRPPGIVPAYGVLRRDEDPREYGFEPTAQLTRTERVAIYAAPSAERSWLNGRPSAYTEQPIRDDGTTYQRAQIGIGSYLEAQPNEPLHLYANSSTIALQPTAGPAAQRALVLTFGSFITQTVELHLGKEQRQIDVGPGQSIYHTGTVTTPLEISLRSLDGPLLLRGAALMDASASRTNASVEPVTDTLLLSLTSEVREKGATTQLDVRNPSGEVLRFAVEIYEDTAGIPAHYAWALFQATQNGTQHIDIDLQTPAATLDGSPLSLQAGTVRDGNYFASLWIYQGDQAHHMLPFLRFERKNGAVANITPLDLNGAFYRLQDPEQSIHTQLGETIALDGYGLSSGSVHPGTTLHTSLRWLALQPQPQQVYLVFVQVLDETNRKIAQWDGAAGGDWYPTPAWQAGQRIWQDVPLKIADDAPPGRYRVIAGLYDPVTGTRLHTTDGNDAVVLGQIDVRPR